MNFFSYIKLLSTEGRAKMNIERLVKKAKKGNKDALLQLIIHKQDELYRLAYSYMKNEHDAMDVLENMIVITYEKVNQLRDNQVFYSWCKTILVNECKQLLVKQNRQILIDDLTKFQDVSHDNTAEKQRQLEVNELLSNVSDTQREAIILKYIHDLDYETIAEVTGVSVGTVKSRVFNGIKKLQNYDGSDCFG